MVGKEKKIFFQVEVLFSLELISVKIKQYIILFYFLSKIFCFRKSQGNFD